MQCLLDHAAGWDSSAVVRFFREPRCLSAQHPHIMWPSIAGMLDQQCLTLQPSPGFPDCLSNSVAVPHRIVAGQGWSTVDDGRTRNKGIEGQGIMRRPGSQRREHAQPEFVWLKGTERVSVRNQVNQPGLGAGESIAYYPSP